MKIKSLIKHFHQIKLNKNDVIFMYEFLEENQLTIADLLKNEEEKDISFLRNVIDVLIDLKNEKEILNILEKFPNYKNHFTNILSFSELGRNILINNYSNESLATSLLHLIEGQKINEIKNNIEQFKTAFPLIINDLYNLPLYKEFKIEFIIELDNLGMSLDCRIFKNILKDDNLKNKERIIKLYNYILKQKNEHNTEEINKALIYISHNLERIQQNSCSIYDAVEILKNIHNIEQYFICDILLYNPNEIKNSSFVREKNITFLNNSNKNNNELEKETNDFIFNMFKNMKIYDSTKSLQQQNYEIFRIFRNFPEFLNPKTYQEYINTYHKDLFEINPHNKCLNIEYYNNINTVQTIFSSDYNKEETLNLLINTNTINDNIITNLKNFFIFENNTQKQQFLIKQSLQNPQNTDLYRKFCINYNEIFEFDKKLKEEYNIIQNAKLLEESIPKKSSNKKVKI